MSVRFAAVGMEKDFNLRLHPTVRAVLVEFAVWSEHEALPEPVVTCLGRDGATNAAAGGVQDSWHLSHCAADLRVRHYSAEQLPKVLLWWSEKRANMKSQHTELITVPHGTGPHIHFAVCDAAWRSKP